MGFLDAFTGAVETVSSVVEGLGGAVESGIGAYTAVKSVIDPAPVRPRVSYSPVDIPGSIPQPGGGYAIPVSQASYGGTTMPYATVMPALGLPGGDIVSDARVAVLNRLTSPFVPTMMGASAQAHVAINPVSGRGTWFRPVGRPIVFSGDKAIATRYAKMHGWRRSRGGR